MGVRLGPLGSVFFFVAACSGPVATPEVTPAPDDAGASPRAEGGTGRARDGGTLLADTGITPVGFQGDTADASLVGDTGAEVGPPPRIDTDAAWTNAVPGGMPQVIDNGGPVVTTPVFQAVTFVGYDLTTEVDDFVARVGSTAYWQKAVGEYGVGAATAAAPLHLASGAPPNIDDTEIQAWLAAEIAAGDGFIAPAAGAVYVLFYPDTTSITFEGEQSCFTMGAYHSSMVVGGASVTYAVVPECSTQSRSALDSTTGAASHEMIEAVTDPMPQGAAPAYSGVDLAHLYYPMVLGGGEIADMCAQWPASFFAPDDLPYVVQRAWSNASTAAGSDPCEPELDGETFFNAVPVLTDTVHVGDPSQGLTTLGAAIAPGTSKIIDVKLYSEADVGPWTVSALNVPIGGSNLSFSWDETTGNNGDTLHLTITVNYAESTYGGEPFLLESSLDGTTNYWVGFVGE